MTLPKPEHASGTRVDPDALDTRLTPAARRALDEAEARRKAALDETSPVELGGRKGPEPTRYGDWEKKGIASDF